MIDARSSHGPIDVNPVFGVVEVSRHACKDAQMLQRSALVLMGHLILGGISGRADAAQDSARRAWEPSYIKSYREELERAPPFHEFWADFDCDAVADFLQGEGPRPDDHGELFAAAVILELGICVTADPLKAAAFYDRAARLSGGTLAALRSGLLYMEGRGVERDIDRASDLFRLGAVGMTWLEPSRSTRVGHSQEIRRRSHPAPFGTPFGLDRRDMGGRPAAPL